jgi:hypothetical protein
MKNYFIKSIIFALAYALLMFLIFGDDFSFIEYSVQALIFGVIVGLSCFFDDKGWNSWKKIGNLFKRKRVDN